MKKSLLPEGFRFERLNSAHKRKSFRCSEEGVDKWLITKALQNQKKHLSVTKVLLDPRDHIVGFYTLATGQVDFSDLPENITRRLPHRILPVAVVAWLGVSENSQGQGFGRRLFAEALRDCGEAGQIFSFVAVIIDCLNDSAKAFYKQWDFEELPGHSYRLYLSSKMLEAMLSKQ